MDGHEFWGLVEVVVLFALEDCGVEEIVDFWTD